MKNIIIIILLALTTSAMATEIKTQITIKASPEKIWSILTNLENYPNWNPFITSISGDLKLNQKIKVTIHPPQKSEMKFKPRVLIFDINKEITWLGHLLIPGLFDGKHQFKIIDNGNGTSTFIQSENFEGILVPLFKNMLNNNTKKGFELMNEKLKELSEREN